MTAPTVIDPAAINHLGAVVHRIRPTWDPPGIRAALEQALTTHPFPDVAMVAVSAARDPKAATPGVIKVRCANGWKSGDEIEPPTRVPDRFTRCDRCGNPHTYPGEPCHHAATANDARAWRDKAKLAIRKAAKQEITP